jgi:predicted Zn-dependent peptidase
MLRTLAGRIDGALALDEAAWMALQSSAVERAEEHAATAATALWAEALRALFAPGTPSSKPAWGDPAELRSATREGLQSFVKERLQPSRVRLVIAGSLDPRETRAALDQTLGRLAARGAASGTAASSATARGPAAWTEKTLPFPAKSQNEVLVVWPGARAKPWDRAATEAIVYLLGETGYAGRLGNALVTPGLVYSVYVALDEDESPGFLTVRTATAPRDTRETLRVIRSILEDAAGGRFTQAELDEAKAYLRGKSARGRSGAAATAATLLVEPAKPIGVPAESLTLDQLNDTARRLSSNGAPLALVAGPGY